jgi:hypothetical protein
MRSSPQRRVDGEGGGGCFYGGVPVTESSSGGDGGGGDILEHQEVNRGVRRGPKEKDEGGTVELTEGGEKCSGSQSSSSDGGAPIA